MGTILGADEEFRKAFKHYREGLYDEAITEAAKAFESVLKTIYDLMNWERNEKDSIRQLIINANKNGLFQNSIEYFKNLPDLLGSTVEIRNKDAAHGDGSKPKILSQHLASFAINQAASSILFLIQSYKNLIN